jgi:hypothetical protein
MGNCPDNINFLVKHTETSMRSPIAAVCRYWGQVIR